jgi:hypothetical protein
MLGGAEGSCWKSASRSNGEKWGSEPLAKSMEKSMENLGKSMEHLGKSRGTLENPMENPRDFVG